MNYSVGMTIPGTDERSRNVLFQLFGIQIQFHIPAIGASPRLFDRRRFSEHPGLFLGHIPGRGSAKADVAFVHRFIAAGTAMLFHRILLFIVPHACLHALLYFLFEFSLFIHMKSKVNNETSGRVLVGDLRIIRSFLQVYGW